MRYLFPLALFTVSFSSPALADLTPQQAWAVWKAQARALGLQLETEEQSSADALQIGEITLTADFPLDLGQAIIRFPGPQFVANGDGSVGVNYPIQARLEADITFTYDDLPTEASAVFMVSSIGQDVVMSGTPDNVTTLISGQRAEMELLSLRVFDVPIKATAGMFFKEYRQRNSTRLGEMLEIESHSDYGKYLITYGLDFSEITPDEGQIQGLIRYANNVIKSKLILPIDGFALNDLATQLRDGLELHMETRSDTYRSEEVGYLRGALVASEVLNTGTGNSFMSLTSEGFESSGQAEEIEYITTLAEFGGELDIMFGGFSGEMKFPILEAENLQPAAIALSLQPVILSDETWALVDPERTLARDPIKLEFDLQGNVQLNTNLSDMLLTPEMQQGAELPVELHDLTLGNLVLEALTARLTGAGEFTFDNNDLETYGGIPRPLGDASFELTGLDEALDMLVASGLIRDEDAMGVRMALGVFAKPGERAGQKISIIEATPKGQLLVNGQRFR